MPLGDIKNRRDKEKFNWKIEVVVEMFSLLRGESGHMGQTASRTPPVRDITPQNTGDQAKHNWSLRGAGVGEGALSGRDHYERPPASGMRRPLQTGEPGLLTTQELIRPCSSGVTRWYMVSVLKFEPQLRKYVDRQIVLETHILIWTTQKRPQYIVVLLLGVFLTEFAILL